MRERKSLLLRLDPAVHDAIARWAAAELRSTNAQIEFLLRRALAQAGRLPTGIEPVRQRGRHRGGTRDGSDDDPIGEMFDDGAPLAPTKRGRSGDDSERR